jgi:hypothetical protein
MNVNQIIVCDDGRKLARGDYIYLWAAIGSTDYASQYCMVQLYMPVN